jgi:hypothetical protein
LVESNWKHSSHIQLQEIIIRQQNASQQGEQYALISSVISLVLFSCGDACATIASGSCFPEPFETPSDRRRLGWVHKQFSGRRHSDHVAMLSAYQAWEDARSVDETAEMQFCESRQLNMSTLRMTSEAQVRGGGYNDVSFFRI